MAKFEQKSIREALFGMVHDHVMAGAITCALTHQVGCELVALLAAYREEERRLYPEVYLLGPSGDDLLSVLSPGSPRLVLGRVPCDRDTVSTSRVVAATALKTCASLAIDGWAVFINRDADAFSFGLFRPAAGPYSGGAEETLATSGVPAVLLRNSAENTVELINSAGGRLEISLTTATPSTSSLSGQIMTFSQIVCADIERESRDQAAGYIARVLTDALRTSHGALLAIVPAGEVRLPAEFADGVVLPEPIPLARTMVSAIRDQSGGTISLLRSYESLLRGMIMSDGVTVLSTDGAIRAFRVILRLPAESRGAPVARPSGGARSRAFEALRGYIGSPLRAALFRSQDGRTEIVV